ncbi:hypothetical protein R3P38DRAFT_2797522 [Favolaschia claudopus]|uniref:Uncharacterized protein n=1 Tax=Favolaschia claudopus TaxID=2862362 RepID=A0AAW0A2N9_9AGAR
MSNKRLGSTTPIIIFVDKRDRHRISCRSSNRNTITGMREIPYQARRVQYPKNPVMHGLQILEGSNTPGPTFLGRTARIPTRMFNSTFDRLLSEIVVIMDRCIAISVINHIPRVADGVLAWLRSTDAPNVKRLDLVLSPGFRRHPTASPLAIVLPHSTITKFVLKHGFVIFDPPSFYSALTHLHIGPVRNEVYFAGLYWRLLRETLQACVVLTHLVLDRVECVDMPPISLPPYSRCAVPTLRYLCIRCEANSTGQILLLLDLPDLSAFRFVGFGPYVEFISVTTVSFYLSVRHLELDTHIISPFMLVTILELFPLLRTLNIQNSSQATVDSLIRSARIADPPLCQFLQEIHVGGVLGIAQVKRILLNRAEGHFSKDVILTYTKIGGDCRDERRSYKVVENVIHRRPYLPPYDLWVTI